MKKLLLVPFLFLAALIPTKAQFVLQYNPAQPGVIAAPIDQNGWHAFKLTVSQNVTNFFFNVIPPAQPPAQSTVSVQFVENATGGFTVVFQSNIVNPCTVNTAANATTVCQFIFDATQNIWNGVTGSGGGGGSSFPVTTPVAVNSGGSITVNTGGSILTAGTGTIAATTATALAATPSQCTGGQFANGIQASGNANCATVTASAASPNGSVQVDNAGALASISGFLVDNPSSPTNLTWPLALIVGGDQQSGGLDPWVDIRSKGGRGVSLHTTGTGSGTSLTVGVNTFVNGDGITVVGGGPTPTMTTPTAPTVVPGEAESETVVDAFMTAGVSGSSTYNYCILAEDASGGVTVCSPTTSITTGTATLGKFSDTLTAISLTGNTLSFTSSGAHNLVQYALAHITSGANSYYLSGWFPIQTITNATNAQATQTVVSSATTVTSASGTLAYWIGNNVTWPAVTGAYRYWVCAQRPGDGSFHIIGSAVPKGTQFVDFGINMTQMIPYYITNANCTAGTAQNQLATTTVTAGGGSTSLTLAAGLTNNVSGAVVREDNAPALASAATAAKSNSAIFIPAGVFEINSPTSFGSANNLGIIQAGNLTANATIFPFNQWQWGGSTYKGWNGSIQFAASAPPAINCFVTPCIDMNQNVITGTTLYNLSIGGNANGILVAMAGNFTNGLQNIQFNTGGNNGSSDFMGVAIWEPQGTPITTECDFCTFISGPSQVIDSTWAPVIEIEGGNPFGDSGMILRSAKFGVRGVFLKYTAGAGGSFVCDGCYQQGGITPLIAFENNNGNSQPHASLNQINLDSSQQAGLAMWGTLGTNMYLCYQIGTTNTVGNDGGGIPSFVTGGGSQSLELIGERCGDQSVNGQFTEGVGFRFDGQNLNATNPLNMGPNLLTATNANFTNYFGNVPCAESYMANNLGILYANLPCSTITPPAVQGQYAVTYNLPTNNAAAPIVQQIGLTGRGLSGATSSDVVLFSDNNSTVVHVQAASGTINPETLPTATTLNNPTFFFKYCNNSPQTDTIVPTTWTIQVGNNAPAASLSVAPSTCFLIHVDPTSATNWLADSNGGSGGGTPCTTTALSFQFNNAGAFGCVPDLTFSSPHTALLGSAGIIDLSAGAPTAAFKVPGVAGAVPTGDKLVGFNLTTHALVWGSNGVTIVGAAAGTGTSGGTTCTSQFISAISATAAPTCTTVTFDKSTTGLGNPTADSTFTQPNTSVAGWTLSGTAPGSSSGATGTNATSLFNLTGVTGGADSNATGTAGIGSSPTVVAGNGGAGTGTNTVGGAGGSYSITAGNGGASAGTGANSNGGSITLVPGAAGTGGSGAAGQNGVVKINGAGAGFVGLVQGADNSGDTLGCAAANTACLEAPASVTTYTAKVPGVAAQGNITGTLSGSIITQGISGDANHSAVVTIGSGTSIGSTQLCPTANCPVGTYRVNAYLDITTACATSGTYLVNLIYTDDQGSKTVPVNIQGTGAVPATGVLTTTSTANFGQAAQIIRSTGAASINYSTTAVACGSAGPMVGKMYLSVEAIQ